MNPLSSIMRAREVGSGGYCEALKVRMIGCDFAQMFPQVVALLRGLNLACNLIFRIGCGQGAVLRPWVVQDCPVDLKRDLNDGENVHQGHKCEFWRVLVHFRGDFRGEFQATDIRLPAASINMR